MLELTKEIIQEKYIRKDGKFNSRKLPNGYTKEDVYLIFYNINKPLCYCGKPRKFKSFSYGYLDNCSQACSWQSEDRINKIKKNTDYKKLGENISKSKSTITKETYKEIHKKSSKTKEHKFGDANYNNREKSLDTYNKHKHKHKLKRDKNFKLKYKDINKYKINNVYDIQRIAEEYQLSYHHVYKVLNKLGVKFKSNNVSNEEFIISSLFNKTVCINNDRNILNGKELDIYIPKYNFAIEYNGLLWHSHNPYQFPTKNQKENKNKHLEKTELCEQNNIQLFHIFENEWLNSTKQEIWKSVINSKLNNHKRIFARKTDIRLVQNKEKDMFLEQNHLQGTCSSKINIGLYYENELVSIMTFGKSRFSKKYEYELLRFASKLNTTIVGGGSKLIKFFENKYKPKSLISYANRRWSTGNFYEAVGFKFSHNSSPNYFYFDCNSLILESRNKYQKHKLHKVLDKFNPDLSEQDNMFNNDYRRIYDSGNKIYIKEY